MGEGTVKGACNGESLIAVIYFVTVMMVVYHLQQKDLDRIQRQIDEMSSRAKFGES
jgi:hypothetical protein